MTWHLLGAGSLGLLWAARLARSGLPATLILRNQSTLDAYSQTGAVRLTQGTEQQVIALPAQTPDHDEPIQRLLLTCKAYDAAPALASVRSRISENTQLLLLQNGMGSQSTVSAMVPEARCILVSSTEGAYRDGSFCVNFAGQGTNWLGDPLNPIPPDWLNELQMAGIAHQWTTSILIRQWRKLAVNCAINPLCVLYSCRNGGLMQHLPEVTALCSELGELLQTCCGEDAAMGLAEEVERVIQATAGNQCSMLQDVQRRQRTEISFLLGFACAKARLGGLHTPKLNELHLRLRNHLQTLGLPVD